MMFEVVASTLSPEDSVARFIFSDRHVRADGTAKPDAFIPHPYPELSVTKKTDIPEDVIWTVGRNVAAARRQALVARADLSCGMLSSHGLAFLHDPTEMDANHWNVIGWPKDKSAQKTIAQQICATIGKVTAPPSNEAGPAKI